MKAEFNEDTARLARHWEPGKHFTRFKRLSICSMLSGEVGNDSGACKSSMVVPGSKEGSNAPFFTVGFGTFRHGNLLFKQVNT